jgi:DNA polymerase-3 subunit delta'
VSEAASPPWFDDARAEVKAALAGDRLAHGLLIHEDPGAGGLELARWIAQTVNCLQPARTPCGECQQCRWIAADQHPDVTRLSPEGDSTQILIQSVRDLSADLALTAHGRGYKIAIIAPAEAMNHFAANALLKTLEEPPARSLRLVGPSRESAAAWLQAARGAGPWAEALAATGAGPFALLDADPAAIAQLHRDTMTTLRDIGSGNLQPPAVADRWAKGELPIRLACLESWVTERILESGSIRDVTHLSGQGIPPNICRLFELSDAVRDMRKLSHTSINKTMAVEALLWRWARQ